MRKSGVCLGGISSGVREKGFKIGNIYFSSHGNPNKAMFNIGNTTINQSDQLNFLTDHLSDKSLVIITACHVGSPAIGGTTLIKNLAKNLNRIVIACQTGCESSSGPDRMISTGNDYSSNPSWINYDTCNDKVGWWSIAVPILNNNKISVELYEGYTLQITSNGTPYFTTNNFKKITTNGLPSQGTAPKLNAAPILK